MFAASSLESGAWGVDPEALSAMVQGLPDVFVLPWHGDALTFDWTSSAEALAPTTTAINAAVEQVERCDPWALANFGVRGVGEGLVYYPVSHEGREAFVNLVFKAKGEQHRVVRARLGPGRPRGGPRRRAVRGDGAHRRAPRALAAFTSQTERTAFVRPCGQRRRRASERRLAFVSQLGVEGRDTGLTVIDVKGLTIHRGLALISEMGRPMSPAAAAFSAMLK